MKRCSLRLAAAVILMCAVARAGGPLYVAGTSEFDSGLAGTPLTWANGQLSYFTDRGALSGALSESAADALVADAFSRWTSVPTAALAATRGGQLDEDVSAANVTRIGDQITLPTDIQTTALAKPVAVVYDADGAVTDALLGAGAGDPALCATNAAFGGPDHFSASGQLDHALVVLNGRCLASTAAVPEMRYRLVRIVGRVLGLGWSQLNDNVVTGTPAPTSDDWLGFPLMHAADPSCSGAVSSCIPDADQLRMDDRAAISRLYPVTAQNASGFSGKQIFATSTAAVHGSVNFRDAWGRAATGMEGVNVVARRIDPATGAPSHRFAISAVSGFLFRGNAGNHVTGFVDASGHRLDRFGSAAAAHQGYFDLAGLELPDGAATADYELSIEAVDPHHVTASTVGPYSHAQVTPSGTADPILLHALARGASVEQSIAPLGAAPDRADGLEPNTFVAPAPTPWGGEWSGSLTGYNDADYITLSLLAGRSLIADIIARDDAGATTTSKAEPVLGIWGASDPDGSAPAVKAFAFNTGPGVTRLSANVLADGDFKLGIQDYRGDGRPDFRYYARILYGGEVNPARIGTQGGAVRIRGLGLHPDMAVSAGGTPLTVLDATREEMIVRVPPLADSRQSLVIADSATGRSVTMTNAVSIGAVTGDTAAFLDFAPITPLGAETPTLHVLVTAPDGTPVPGATLNFSATPAGSLFTACNTTICRLTTDAAGIAATSLLVKTPGPIAVSALLPDGTGAVTTVSTRTLALDIGAAIASTYVPQSVAFSVPLRVRVTSNGLPASGRTVSFNILQGTATLSARTATTNSTGDAQVNASSNGLTASVRVLACVSPANAPCVTVWVKPVAALQMTKVGGDEQVVGIGESLLVAQVRVTDASSPPNGVTAAPVKFNFVATRLQAPIPPGESPTPRRSPLPIAQWTVSATSDPAGLASAPITVPTAYGPASVSIHAETVGASADFSATVVSPVSTQASLPPALPAAASSTGPPTHSPSCTKAGCSAVSGRNGPRRGNKASSKAPSAAATW